MMANYGEHCRRGDDYWRALSLVTDTSNSRRAVVMAATNIERDSDN